ncbi:cytochrome b [Acidisoma sp. 7E03]
MAAAYSVRRIALHWLSAGVILWATVSGFLAASQPPGSALRDAIDLINPQLTTLFIPFFVWRLGLFLAHWPRPRRVPLPVAQKAAQAGHALLYGAITLVLTSGYLMMPVPWHLLGLVPMPSPLQGTPWLGPMHGLHRLCCMALALLVCGHLAAVAAHHWAGDPVLRRMRPARA